MRLTHEQTEWLVAAARECPRKARFIAFALGRPLARWTFAAHGLGRGGARRIRRLGR